MSDRRLDRYVEGMKTVQMAEIISEGGRTGSAEASDGSFSVHFAPPGEDGSQGVTPEHLFGAAYSACFHSALLSHAEKSHCKIVGSTVTAHVALNENERGEYELRVELRAALPGVSESTAKHLLHEAHRTCPYSRALRGNVTVEIGLD
jgi:lipoyl-dependent peroxiredoxin